MSLNKRLFIELITILAFFALGGCNGNTAQNQALTPVSLQLKWVHDAEFAGFYTAELKGYYEDEGLDVSFLPGGTEVDTFAAVTSGSAQFGVASAIDIISHGADGEQIAAIATIFRRNPTAFFALASSGIKTPQDFVGKTIRAASDQPLVLHAMMAKLGISPDQYSEILLPSDPAMVITGEVPVWGSYITSLALIVQRDGYQINIIYPDDYGIHFYGDTIFTTDDLIASNPELVQRFLSATLKGWTYVIENPTEAGTFVAQYKPDADIELENAKMTASIPLINTGEDFIGWMKPELWASMDQTLREQLVITQPVDLSLLVNMQFLEEIYK